MSSLGHLASVSNELPGDHLEEVHLASRLSIVNDISLCYVPRRCLPPPLSSCFSSLASSSAASVAWLWPQSWRSWTMWSRWTIIQSFILMKQKSEYKTKTVFEKWYLRIQDNKTSILYFPRVNLSIFRSTATQQQICSRPLSAPSSSPTSSPSPSSSSSPWRSCSREYIAMKRKPSKSKWIQTPARVLKRRVWSDLDVCFMRPIYVHFF